MEYGHQASVYYCSAEQWVLSMGSISTLPTHRLPSRWRHSNSHVASSTSVFCCYTVTVRVSMCFVRLGYLGFMIGLDVVLEYGFGQYTAYQIVLFWWLSDFPSHSPITSFVNCSFLQLLLTTCLQGLSFVCYWRRLLPVLVVCVTISCPSVCLSRRLIAAAMCSWFWRGRQISVNICCRCWSSAASVPWSTMIDAVLLLYVCCYLLHYEGWLLSQK